MQAFLANDSLRLQIFIMSANQFVHKAMDILVSAAIRGDLDPRRANAYIKEILHIILFYGQINRPKVDPEEILQESNHQLSARYSDVFEMSCTHIPKRPPFTVLLNAIVDIVRTRHEDYVLPCLLSTINDMEVPNGNTICRNIFVSTVINLCYFSDQCMRSRTPNYFGASVSCRGARQRKIMIDILCYHTWHRDISWAVCVANQYNENAIEFPPRVRSMAFNIYTNGQRTQANQRVDNSLARFRGRRVPRFLEIASQFGSLVPRAPCERCFEMFPNIQFYPFPQAHEHAHWEYGNCAECESLSQLLKSHEQIVTRLHRNQFQIGRDDLINAKNRRLEQNLQQLEFRFRGVVPFEGNQL
ncbi:uncharacterized protein LOC122562194 [Chiloscyllium plagiosum]|uniref:uncharacterized protein LOC122562194 n=1 Tax=Chiloscyllium plagiosum TaxID=36176 RepID=UPI001CB7ADFA|nr:uncharacterized protein LOC122562194 [Chiloscyllium plagiosum]XP_043570795.1 uncharacterized protein LOC122562194 [Chiloscyllium plagiosum]